jgi:hypothetical protein
MNGYELLAQFEKNIKDCFYVPNEKLPEYFRDERTDSVSLSTLERKCTEREVQSEYAIAQQQKAERIKIYAEQIASGQEITYISKLHTLPL